MVKISDMRQKEVINISDGKRLGFVCEIEFDLEKGNIETLIVPGEGKLLSIFGKNNEICIPWESIRRIGDDIILVDYEERYTRR